MSRHVNTCRPPIAISGGLTCPAAGPELKKTLNQRQLTMIAMGGVIGAGLFVGSGTVIHATGPGAFLTYALCGVLIILVMRMLAEMAVANPSTGSFADYSRKALGDWAGFSVGWLYWYFWVIVVGFEAVAGAKVINFWLPGVPTWVLSLVLMLLMTGTNLISVSSFGEFEFWFAGIKVGGDHRLPRLRRPLRPRDLAQRRPRLQQPHRARRLLPQRRAGGHGGGRDGHLLDGGRRDRDHRRGGVRTTPSGPSPRPPTRSSPASRSSSWARSSCSPSSCRGTPSTLEASPYVAAFQEMGIPYADHVMNAVVLTAVLSCLNSGLYTASRMLFVLAARREAPASMVSVNSRGVPVVAILSSSVVGFLAVIMAAVSPDTVFSFLLNSSGAVILFVYLLIADLADHPALPGRPVDAQGEDVVVPGALGDHGARASSSCWSRWDSPRTCGSSSC